MIPPVLSTFRCHRFGGYGQAIEVDDATPEAAASRKSYYETTQLPHALEAFGLMVNFGPES